MRVIPAIDLLDGQVVRLHKGDYENVTVYNDDPVSEAQTFKEAGFDHIHVIDLNGAKEGAFVTKMLPCFWRTALPTSFAVPWP